MRQITAFTTGFLAATSIAIIISIPRPVDVISPSYEYAEPSYTIEKLIDGWCASRVIRRGITHEATYCAGEFGQILINIPHTDSPEWDDVFQEMMNEVDSLAGVGR